MGRIVRAAFTAIGILALAMFVGVAAAVTVFVSVPGLAGACTQGPVCYFIRSEWFPLDVAGVTVTMPPEDPVDEPQDIAVVPAECLSQPDAQRLYQLARFLVTDQDNVAISFGEAQCVPVRDIISKVCATLGNDVADASRCDALMQEL